MKVLAWILVAACAVLYGYDGFKTWLQNDTTTVSETRSPSAVFPEAMKNIRPIDNPENYIEQAAAKARAEQAAQEALAREQEEQAKLAAQAQAQQTPTVQPLSEAIQAQARLYSAEHSDRICLRTSVLSPRQLPVVNRSLQSAGLLEAFQIESELSADRYVVFIVPSATRRGAELLATQIKKQGFSSARVVTDGPLNNAVQLGSFSSEERAQAYLAESAKKLDMTALRVSRIIGEATGRVSLVFADLTDKQVQGLRRVAQQRGFELTECQ